MEILFQAQIGKETMSLRSGKLAKQASGSVMVQYGETMVLVTVVADKNARPEVDFLPLSVEYQEKIYSAGRIPGNYFRREIGRPSEKETLTARLTDRPLRPLFAKDWRYETQVIATVLSMDKANDPDVLSINGASAALMISDIPFDGPVACVRVGRVDGAFVVNPTIEEQKVSDLNIIVAGSRTGINMVEGGCDVAKESDVLDAIFFAHEQLQPIIDMQEKLRESVGKPKREHTPREKDADLTARIDSLAEKRMADALQAPEKIARQKALSDLKAAVITELGEEFADRKSEIKEIFYDLERRILRDIILNQGHRIDGRGFTDIRPIQCEAALLPRVHGSGLFTRGETQVLAAMTMGSGRDEQRVETLSGNETR
ncbi:MAG: polyribonucleotide nucleotidyltransferase, partial [Desulfobacteraceae bacterium]